MPGFTAQGFSVCFFFVWYLTFNHFRVPIGQHDATAPSPSPFSYTIRSIYAMPLSCFLSLPHRAAFSLSPRRPLSRCAALPLRAATASSLHQLMVWGLGCVLFFIFIWIKYNVHLSLQTRAQSHTSPRCRCALSAARTSRFPLQPLSPQGTKTPHTSLACFVVTHTLCRTGLKFSYLPCRLPLQELKTWFIAIRASSGLRLSASPPLRLQGHMR